MSIEELETIDAVCIDPLRAICLLTVVDHLPWSPAHLEALQCKINRYLRWIESGEIYLHYPKAAGCEFHIVITAIFEPDSVAKGFIDQAKAELEASGFELTIVPLASAYADITQ